MGFRSLGIRDGPSLNPPAVKKALQADSALLKGGGDPKMHKYDFEEKRATWPQSQVARFFLKIILMDFGSPLLLIKHCPPAGLFRPRVESGTARP